MQKGVFRQAVSPCCVLCEWDVNVLLTLPLQDPAVIKAFLETWLHCSLWKSAQKNITAGGDTGILITLFVCICVCVCARADACVHMWMCCIFYSVQCQYFAGLHSSISLCVSLQYSICGFECVFICSQAKEWLQAANDISNRQVDLIETSFLTAAARVLRGSATCCLHYKPLDHQAYHAGLCVSVFNNVSDSSECSILAPLTYFVVLHCKFIQVWKVVQNISGRRQILATS